MFRRIVLFGYAGKNRNSERLPRRNRKRIGYPLGRGPSETRNQKVELYEVLGRISSLYKMKNELRIFLEGGQAGNGNV